MALHDVICAPDSTAVRQFRKKIQGVTMTNWAAIRRASKTYKRVEAITG